jgi:prophage antirepressor-like protein
MNHTYSLIFPDTGDTFSPLIKEDGSIWFYTKAACDILGLPNSSQAIKSLDDDEKGVTINDTLGGRQTVSIISESGLYALILKSRKPQAKAFRRWVTGVVIPAIREQGFYSVFPNGDDADAKKLEARVAGQMSHIRSAVEALRDPLPEGYGSLGSLLKSFGMEVDAGQRLRAACAVRNACREAARPIIYRWNAKAWRVLGHYPRELAKEALLKALPDSEPTPDLFENWGGVKP